MPLWVPVVLAVFMVAVQYAVAPAVLEWLVPAQEIPCADGRYLTEHRLGAVVARRCRQAGIPLVRLGVIDDGSPNAFVFGHWQRDARLFVSRGLLERLDDDELDAVVAHEISHVRHHDFVVMTVASLIPVLLYYVAVLGRSQSRAETVPVMVCAYVGYVIGQLAVLALSRSRELYADHSSCAMTGNGDALASALVKIAYGMGQMRIEQQEEVRRLREEAKTIGRREAARQVRRLQRETGRFDSVRGLGIADPTVASGVTLAAEQNGLRGSEVLGALSWESCSPWATVREKLSTHPTVLHRIAALESSGLAGAPRQWRATGVGSSCDRAEVARARRRFAGELPLAAVFYAALVVAVVTSPLHDWFRLGQALLGLGATGLVLAALRHPPFGHQPVDRITSLLERADAYRSPASQ